MLLAWVVTWLGLGGALAEARLVLHIVLATGCLLGLTSSDRLLARVGVTKQWMLAGALLALSPLLSLVPLPRVLLQVTSPGRLEAWPGVTLAPSTHAPWATLAGLGSLVAVVTFAVLATLATKHGASRRQVERLVVIVSAGVMATALAHGLAGARAAFGVLPIQADGIRYLPLVNENHLAALIVLLMPVLIGRTVTASREAERWVAGITVGLAWVLLLLIQSTAGLLLGVLVTVSTARALGLNRTTLLAGIAVTAPGISVWAVLGPRATEAHILPRLWHWLDALRLTADHWLLGAGLGTYAEAIRPYRTDTAFVRWNHAHNELVHGLAELGLVGLIAAAAALWALRPSEAPEQRDTAWRIDLGLGAVALHSLVEFPLHLPTVALTVAGLWATRLALHGSTRPAQPRLARVSLLLLCLLNVAAAGVTTRQLMVERAVTAYTPGQSSSLASWAPRHPLTALDHLDEGPEAILAIAADAPDVLIQAANLLIEELRDDEALVLLTQARTRSPSDRRIPMLQAWIHTRSGKLSLASRAWVDAFAAGAPPEKVSLAVRTLPLGSWWLDELAGTSPAHHLALARAVSRTEPEVALEALAVAVRGAPDAYTWIPENAQYLRLADRYDEARAWTTRAVATVPDRADLWWEHAETLRRSDTVASLDAARTAALMDRRFGVRAMRLHGEVQGPDAALRLARELDLRARLTPAGQLERARWNLRAGERGRCRALLERLVVDGDPNLQAQLDDLRERCN